MPNIRRDFTIKENMVNGFFLLETENTTSFIVISNYSFAK
jgi:hypothetical protein